MNNNFSNNNDKNNIIENNLINNNLIYYLYDTYPIFLFILIYIFGFFIGYYFEYLKDKFRNSKRGTVSKISKRIIDTTKLEK